MVRGVIECLSIAPHATPENARVQWRRHPKLTAIAWPLAVCRRGGRCRRRGLADAVWATARFGRRGLGDGAVWATRFGRRRGLGDAVWATARRGSGGAVQRHGPAACIDRGSTA